MRPAQTPSRNYQKHQEINLIVRDLNTTCQVRLSERGTSHTAASVRSVADKCLDKLRVIYFKDEPQLRVLLGKYKRDVGNKLFHDEKLNLLLERLEPAFQRVRLQITPTGSATSSANSRTVIPGKDAKPSAPPIGSIRKPNFRRQLADAESGSVKMLIDQDQHFTSAAESLSGTLNQHDTEDEDFETAPTSPSAAARRRRRQNHFSDDVKYPDLTSGKKRPSDEISDRNSPKYSRTSTGRQSRQEARHPEEVEPGSYRKPTALGTSFTSDTTVATSAKTSFASTNAANESFRTDTTDITIPLTSSATIGSVDHDTFLEAENQAIQSKVYNSIQNLQMELPSSSRQSERDSQSVFDEGGQDTGLGPEPYQIRDLYKQGLFVSNIPSCYRNLSFVARWECTRIALANDIPAESVAQVSDLQDTYESFWNHIEQQQWYTRKVSKGDREVWKAASVSYEGWSFKARLTVSTRKEKSLFRLALNPPAKETSCRFQRAFGSDRFLYLTMPAPKDVLKLYGGFQKAFHERLLEWLQTIHEFLGRSWRVFHVEPEKVTKTGRLRDELPGIRVVLFALSGSDLEQSVEGQRRNSARGIRPSKGLEMTLYELFNWFMPLADSKNAQQPYCKAFARLDLGFSRARPMYVFKPSQIRFIEDIKADGSREDTRYNDPRLNWSLLPRPGVDMTDGCGLLSVEAARQIWNIVGTKAPVPSAFQARIAGAKGVWFVHSNSTDRNVWIEIRKSQLKFEPHSMDKNDEAFDKLRLTFEMVNFTRPLKTAGLHEAFLPILVDRGVDPEYIYQIMQEGLDAEKKEVLELFRSTEDSPKLLRKWLDSQGNRKLDAVVDVDTLMHGGLPAANPERIKMLLDAGFKPHETAYLADTIKRVITKHLMTTAKNFRLPLAKTTHVMGVADPYGVLKPGEIHLQFSSLFHDSVTGESFPFLDRMEVLVGRHPAIRKSDVQKVRARFVSALSHLVDIVVFPSRGSHALADKLQGGDYDGDTFWVCWEPKLTENFRNAPAPVSPAEPADYNIQVDKRPLSELVDLVKRKSLRNYLRESFSFRLKPSFLGMATVAHTNLCYKQNNIDSPGIRAFADVHDLLVDWIKNGYTFTSAHFEKLRKEHISGGALSEPAYKRSMKAIAKSHELGKLLDKLAGKAGPRRNIHDHLFYNLLVPHIAGTVREVNNKASAAQLSDPALCKPSDDERYLCIKDGNLMKEIKALDKRLEVIRNKWTARLMPGIDRDSERDADHYNETVDQCYEMYTNVQPIDADHPIVCRWRYPFTPGAPSTWELLKASALFIRWHDRPSLVFQLAGKELAYIKACSSGNARHLTYDMWAYLKPRKLLKSRPDGDDGPRNVENNMVDEEDEVYESDGAEFLA